MKTRLLALFSALAMALSALADIHSTEAADTIIPLAASDTITPLRGRNWVEQLINSGFHINDPRINYPRFPRFALKVYNWGDHTFNHYDSTFVVGSGKNWKAQLKNELWMRTYMMELADKSTIHITSRLYDDIGLYVSFMAVSLGYTINLNNYMGDDTKRHRFDLSFTCSRLAFNYWHQKVIGGAMIRKFGDYDEGHRLSYKFSDIDVADTHMELYYIFNNKEYSQAAAYCFSKYQLKSAGSWILGFSYDRHNMELDFSNMPREMLAALPTLQTQYHIRYSDYCVIGGYARNWVLYPRRWLINLTTLPFIGYKHSSTDDKPDRDIRDMISINLGMMGSVVYNHRALFLALQARFNGFLNLSPDYTFFSSTQLGTLVVGFRF
ncbi:MAG: DUF4421 domain-containing protein [Pseudoflavonifractor sp.]|nr:DUF4421 domain-containing protein [Alloprevotella sp.]MCM1116612.1 DUF4421 domain-containing protein [Pseudoflavonifractor sp.]